MAHLRGKPGGGAEWLLALRGTPYPDAVASLCELSGVGPKVGPPPPDASVNGCVTVVHITPAQCWCLAPPGRLAAGPSQQGLHLQQKLLYCLL